MNNMNKEVLKLMLKPHKIVKHRKDIMDVINIVNISTFDLVKYSLELSMNNRFFNYINDIQETAIKSFQDPRLGGNIDFISCTIIYSIVRHIKPEIIVETGVGPGGSSAFILQALNDNKKGFLYSIDLPGNDAVVYPKLGKFYNIHVPEGWEVGWLIPPWLKERHQLIIGDSREELPKLMNELRTVDIFLHDSLHTDEHVLMEFNTVFPYTSRKGILLCDDVNEYWSLAFMKFCETKQIPYVVFNNRLGMANLSEDVRLV